MDSFELSYLRSCEQRERAAAKLARSEEARRHHRQVAAVFSERIARLERSAAAPAKIPAQRAHSPL
ncbi:hypothetical protein [Sphingomonas ginkgonis]|nr:hypothetical protein [Sphingomonas ginkgonis]